MDRCTVCGKPTLIPERFGKINICKSCFIKANGLIWKHTYDKYDIAEKQRNFALESVRKHNYPQPVITAINDYFTEQIDKMHSCIVCSKNYSNLVDFDGSYICTSCFKKISNTPEWNEDDYGSNEEVEENRAKILKIAHKAKYPQPIIDGINKHFDSKIQKGLIDTVYGEGQTLKVYETHCILKTHGSFDDDEISKKYAKLLKKSKLGGGLISNNVAQALVHSVLGGGIVKAGVSLATSAVVSATANAISPNRASFKVRKGNQTLSYDYYDIVEFQKVLPIGFEDELGYMRFRSSFQTTSDENSFIFFFDHNYSAEKMYNYICDRIEAMKKKHIENNKKNSVEVLSSADEILKFKQLLDIGAITQEEYDIQKERLLSK